jgi:hypothetical protein
VDPDRIWVGLCEGDKEAIGWSMTVFSDYVEYLKRMVNSASTPLAMWRKLIKEAGFTVLNVKRAQECGNKEKWRHRFHNHNARFPSSSVDVFEVSKVSFLCCCVFKRAVIANQPRKVALDRPCNRSAATTHQAAHVPEGRGHCRGCPSDPSYLVRTCW